MREFILAIIFIVFMKLFLMLPEDIMVFENARVAIGFGFLMITAYVIGLFFNKIKLPKISGYLLAGMLFGPHILHFFDRGLIGDMTIINQLALTFIALNAGGELRLKELSQEKRTIFWLLILLIAFIFTGMFLFTFIARPFIAFIQESSFNEVIVIAMLLGTLSIARSPSSIIAIINECRAKGPFSETVLGVTVIIDFFVIMLFAVVVSFSEAILNPSQGMDIVFLLGVGLDVFISAAAGIIIGAFVAYYIKTVKVNVPILLLVLAFLIYNVSGVISHFVSESLNVSFHLEPLLIAITAGFYIQNFTPGGPHFIESIESSSLPVYVLFFAISGLVLDLEIMMQLIHIAVVMVIVRGTMAMLSGYLAGRITKTPHTHSRTFGLGFITQAGVSIGLALEIIRLFPGWGIHLGTLIIAVINFNQIIGPIAFKFALSKVGEIRQK
ncbi:cation:proton antiporter [candidate division KSB1 bacterium]